VFKLRFYQLVDKEHYDNDDDDDDDDVMMMMNTRRSHETHKMFRI